MRKFDALTVDSVALLVHIHSLNQKFKFDPEHLSCFYLQSCSSVSHMSCFFFLSPLLNIIKMTKTKQICVKHLFWRLLWQHTACYSLMLSVFFINISVLEVFDVLNIKWLLYIKTGRVWCFEKVQSTQIRLHIFDKSNWIWQTDSQRPICTGYVSARWEREVMVGLRDGLELI